MGIQLISGAVIVTALLGAVTAFAHPPCGEMPHMQPPPPSFECGPPPPPPPLPSVVRDQIDDLLEAEQLKVMPLQQKLQKNRHALRKAAAKQPFDEAAVKTLVNEQAKLQAELQLSHLRTQSKINQLMEQNRPSQR